MPHRTVYRYLSILLILPACQAAAAPVEFALGTEYYRETYREYAPNSQRLMQQKADMWALNAGLAYPFDNRHAVKLEAGYARGKAHYTGGYNPNEQHPQGTPYGSLSMHGMPHQSYNAKALYEYAQPLSQNTKLVFQAGPGYRVLQDQSGKRHPAAYNRENRLIYAGGGVGLNVGLSHRFELAPKITYNRLLRGTQYSRYSDLSVKNTQRKGRGVEAELSLSRQLPNHAQISLTPFYRSWNISASDTVEIAYADGNRLAFTEPKNRTHETGLKLQYRF